MNIFFMTGDTSEDKHIISQLRASGDFSVRQLADIPSLLAALAEQTPAAVLMRASLLQQATNYLRHAERVPAAPPLFLLHLLEGEEPAPVSPDASQRGAHHLYLAPSELELLPQQLAALITEKEATLNSILQTIFQLSPLLLTEFDLDRLLQRIITETVKLFPLAEAGSLLLLEDDFFVFRAVTGYDERLKTVRLPKAHPFLSALQAGETLHIPKIAAEDRRMLPPDLAQQLHQYGHTEEIEDTLVVPLRLEEELIGYLTVDSFVPGQEFSSTTEQALHYFATLATIAIHNARLYSAEQAARSLTATWQEIGHELTSTLDLDTVWDHLLTSLTRFIDYDATYVLLKTNADFQIVRWYGRKTKPANGIDDPHYSLEKNRNLRMAAQQRAPVLVHDTRKYTGWIDTPGTEWIRSHISTPLFLHDELVGFIEASSATTAAFQKKDGEILASLAPLAAIALHNAQQYAELQQRTETLKDIRQVGVELNTYQDTPAILQRALTYAIHFTQVTSAIFFRYDPQEQQLTQAESAGTASSAAEHRSAPRGGIAEQAWAAQKPILCSAESMLQESPTSAEMPALIALPVTWQTKQLGVLTLCHHTRRPLSTHEIRQLDLLTQQISMNLYRSYLLQTLRRDRDKMTALAKIDQKIVGLTQTSTEALKAILGYAVELVEVPKGIIALAENADPAQLTMHTLGLQNPASTIEKFRASWSAICRLHTRRGAKEYIAIQDLSQELPEYLPLAPHDKGALLSAPLWIRGAVAGVLILLDNQPHHWQAEEITLARMLAQQAAIALEKALLIQELERRLADTEALNRILSTVNTQLDQDDILSYASEKTKTLLGVSLVAINLYTGKCSCTHHPEHPLSSPNLLQRFQEIPRLQSILRQQVTIRFTDIHQTAPDIIPALPAPTHGLLLIPLIMRGEAIGILTLATDTPHTFTEHEIALAKSIANAITPALENAKLYQEAQEARQNIQQAYDDLHRLDIMKSQFIQNVSHELRTPLSIVKGYVDLLVKREVVTTNDSLAKPLAAVQAHANELVDIVEAITTLENMEVGTMNIRPQPILPIFQRAIQATLQKSVRRKVQQVEELPAELPRVNLDSRQLGLATLHLLDNAIKFSTAGHNIWIRAWEEEELVYFQVEDEGIGIAPAEQAHIFERFYQVDGSMSRQYGGMGLGLAIVKAVIEGHRGKIWVESAGVEQGSTFTFTLPIYQPRQGSK